MVDELSNCLYRCPKTAQVTIGEAGPARLQATQEIDEFLSLVG